MKTDPATKAYHNQYWSTEGFRPRGRTTLPIQRLLEENTSDVSTCLDVGCGDGRTMWDSG